MTKYPFVLANTCMDIRDGTHDSPDFVSNGIPLVTSKNLKNGSLDFSECNFITEDDHNNFSKRSFVEKGDILYAMIGTIGNPVIVDTDKIFSIKNVALFKFNQKDKIYNRYFYHFLNSDVALKQLSQLSRGGTQKFVSLGNLRNLKIPLPPLEEQRRIASILDKADQIRQKRQQAIAKLDELLQATFIDMFGDPIKNEKGWKIGKIGDMLESVKYGSSDKATLDGEVPILRMNNITYSGEMYLADLKYITADQADEKYLVKQGDILFNRTNSKELVGKTAVYNGPEPMAYAGYLVRGRTLPEYMPEYISGFLNSSWGKSTLQSMCKSIIGMANINAKEFQSIRLPIPPSDLQKQFTKKVHAIRDHKLKLEKQLVQNDELFKALQQKAFNGTL